MTKVDLSTSAMEGLRIVREWMRGLGFTDPSFSDAVMFLCGKMDSRRKPPV